MSVATQARTTTDDGRVAFHVTWEQYRQIASAVGDQRVHLAYDGEQVELMSPGPIHEELNGQFQAVLLALAEDRGVPCLPMGATRWEALAAERGLEADSSYYLTEAKIAVARLRPKDAAELPPPDLAFEVDLRRSRVDRPAIYAALGVPEVWRHDGETLRFEVLRDNRYVEVEASPVLAVRSADLAPWLEAPEDDLIALLQRFRAWLRGHP